MTVQARTYTWEDPVGLLEAGRQMAGLDLLQAIQRGALPHPPICATIGLRFVEVADGRVAILFDPSEHQYNPHGIVHHLLVDG